LIDYSLIDQPEAISFMFYPRQDHSFCPGNAFDYAIPVEEKVSVTCRFYLGGRDFPWVLYFHGNGEVVSDYDDIAPFYHKIGLNLVVADYRGYGASQGFPLFSNMVEDAHRIFSAAGKKLAEKGLSEKIFVMGRSLGSISALELAYNNPDKLKGVIIESGFASIVHLLRHYDLFIGVDTGQFNKECIEMVSRISIPALIIHGENDQHVSLKQGKFLFNNLGSSIKKMVTVPGASHNDIMFYGMKQYFEAIKEFTALTA
jgi:pimeloyl-ACP methyl ester carboxylesterase